MADATPKPYSVAPNASVDLDGPIYGLRVISPQRGAYVKVDGGIQLPLTTFCHYDLSASQAWPKLKLVNPSTFNEDLEVELQFSAGVPFGAPVNQPNIINNAGNAVVEAIARVASGGTSLSTVTKPIALDDWGKLLMGEGEMEQLFAFSTWDGQIADGTHYLTEDGPSGSAQYWELSPYYSGIRLELYNAVLAGGAFGPTVAFFIDEVDDDGNILKEHPAGTVNNFATATTGGYIHLRHGAEERATDTLTRRVGVRPSRVQFRYVTANVTSFSAKVRVLGLR
jgi:hypothetical protein